MSGKEMDWAADKLKRLVKEQITEIFTSILHYAEVAVDGKDRFQTFRSKVLRISNDAIRNLSKEIEAKYEVKYKDFGKDLIIVKPKGDRNG